MMWRWTLVVWKSMIARGNYKTKKEEWINLIKETKAMEIRLKKQIEDN